MYETKKSLIFLIILGSLLTVGIWIKGLSGLGVSASEQARLDFPEVAGRFIASPQKHENLTPLNLTARSVLVKDRNSGSVLYEKSPDQRLPIASLTKLMTAIVVQKNTSLDEVVEVRSQDLQVSPFRVNFYPGEKLTVRDLVAAMLIASGNDATLTLARLVGPTIPEFVAQMNQEAQNLGMSDTAFTNPVGFDDEGHYSTASDLAKLVQEFLNYPELLELVRLKDAVISSVDGRISHKLYTTNKLLLDHPEVMGLKTGYTTEAKGNLIILVDEGQSLTDGQESPQYYSIMLGSENREAETLKIMNWVKENFEWK